MVVRLVGEARSYPVLPDPIFLGPLPSLSLHHFGPADLLAPLVATSRILHSPDSCHIFCSVKPRTQLGQYEPGTQG